MHTILLTIIIVTVVGIFVTNVQAETILEKCYHFNREEFVAAMSKCDNAENENNCLIQLFEVKKKCDKKCKQNPTFRKDLKKLITELDDCKDKVKQAFTLCYKQCFLKNPKAINNCLRRCIEDKVKGDKKCEAKYRKKIDKVDCKADLDIKYKPCNCVKNCTDVHKCEETSSERTTTTSTTKLTTTTTMRDLSSPLTTYESTKSIEAKQTTDESPKSNESTPIKPPTTTNESRQLEFETTKESPQTTGESPQTTGQSPQTTGESLITTNESQKLKSKASESSPTTSESITIESTSLSSIEHATPIPSQTEEPILHG